MEITPGSAWRVSKLKRWPSGQCQVRLVHRAAGSLACGVAATFDEAIERAFAATKPVEEKIAFMQSLRTGMVPA